MKISVLTSSQSSVMMLMFRFSQEFPRKGNDKAVTLGSPTACKCSHSTDKYHGSSICSYREQH